MSQYSYRIQLWMGTFFILGCVAYSLPWVTNPGAGLSFGAYDLAEWASLHSTARESTPMLLTSFLLRLPLACLGLLITIGFFRENSWLRVIPVLLIGIALLPPLEFFTQYRDDANYRQQFFLALTTGIAGVLSVNISGRWYVKLLVMVLVLIAVTSSLWGLIQGYSLMRAFNLSTQVSFGGVSLITILILYLFATIQALKQTR